MRSILDIWQFFGQNERLLYSKVQLIAAKPLSQGTEEAILHVVKLRSTIFHNRF